MSDFPYLPQTSEDHRDMLEKIGVMSIDELIDDAIQSDIHLTGKLPIPDGLPDIEVEKIIGSFASENHAVGMKNFIGGGAYNMYVPAPVDEIVGRPEFYTAYTPYQPEVSQGTLAAIFEFQSMMTALTAMDISNASMYDGASATAEAAILALHFTNRKRVVYSQGLNPLYLEVLRTYIHGFDAELVPLPLSGGITDISALENLIDDNTACVIIQNPNFFGIVENGRAFSEIIHSKNALYIVSIPDPMSLGIIAPPGDYGADIAVGEAQQFGNYVSYGGPYIGFFTAKREFLRSMPGRIIGMTEDVDGKRGFVMVFQTREQHIRRARATSNICSNQQLCALRATIYLSLLGSKGFKKISDLLFARAHYLVDKLTKIDGVSMLFDAPFFREFAVKIQGKASDVVESLARKGILPGLNLGRFYPYMEDVLLIASSDMLNRNDIDEFVDSMRKYWNEI